MHRTKLATIAAALLLAVVLGTSAGYSQAGLIFEA